MRKTFLVSVIIILLILLGVWWYFGFSLEFSKFFASDNLPRGSDQPRETVGPATPLATPIPPAGAVTCTVVNGTAQVGGRVVATATGGNGTYAWTAPEGTPGSGSGTAFTTAYDTPGRKLITVLSARGGSNNQGGAGGQIDSYACPVIITQ